jgi:hypothetical protein
MCPSGILLELWSPCFGQLMTSRGHNDVEQEESISMWDRARYTVYPLKHVGRATRWSDYGPSAQWPGMVISFTLMKDSDRVSGRA